MRPPLVDHLRMFNRLHCDPVNSLHGGLVFSNVNLLKFLGMGALRVQHRLERLDVASRGGILHLY